MINQILMLALALGASYFFSFRYLQPHQSILALVLMCTRVTLSALFIYKLLELFNLLP